MFASILGWLGNIGFIYGIYAVGKKQVIGFYSCVLGNILYICNAHLTNNNPLYWVSFLLMVLNIKAIWEWTSKKRILKQGYRKAQKNTPDLDREKEWKRLLKEKENVKSNCRCGKNKCH